jgi:hypothetical protein
MYVDDTNITTTGNSMKEIATAANIYFWIENP